MMTFSDCSRFVPLLLLYLFALVLWAFGWLPWQHALLLALFAIGVASVNTLVGAAKLLLWCVLILLGLALALYKPSSVTNPVWFGPVALFDGGKTFTLQPNLAKGLAGWMLLYGLWQTQAPYVRLRMGQLLVLVVGAVASVLAVAIVSLELAWHFKWGMWLIAFAFANLLFTCVAEEAFMRLLIQQPLHSLLKKRSVIVRLGLPLLLVSVLFALTHAPANGPLFWVFAWAGFSYGLVYALSGRVLTAVLVHFAVNLVHITCLTYPL